MSHAPHHEARGVTRQDGMGQVEYNCKTPIRRFESARRLQPSAIHLGSAPGSGCVRLSSGLSGSTARVSREKVRLYPSQPSRRRRTPRESHPEDTVVAHRAILTLLPRTHLDHPFHIRDHLL